MLNTMATVWPAKDPIRFWGIVPDLIDRLCDDALRTSVVNSAGVRSAIDRKCRGAKGEVAGMAGDDDDEY